MHQSSGESVAQVQIDATQAATGTVPPADDAKARSTVRRHRRFAFGNDAQLLVAFVLLSTVFAIAYPDTFASAANLQDMTRVGAILLIVAVGQMFALMVGGFDISVGATMGLVSTVAALEMRDGTSVGVAVTIALACGVFVGLANGIIVAVLHVPPFVTTLGTMTFLVGLSNHLSDGASISGLPAEFRQYGGSDWGSLPSSVVIATTIALIAWLLLGRLRFGLYLQAIGGSRETARTSGIAVARYEVLAYATCGLLSAVGGIVLASRVTVGQASLGQGYELLSIATAVIGGVAIGGGTGRLRGVLLGVALFIVLTTGLDIAGVGQFEQQMVTGAVLVLSVIATQRHGIKLPFRKHRTT
jgi:ribose transport system permease protein